MMISKLPQAYCQCLAVLLISFGFYATASLAEPDDSTASDVARLKALLKSHDELMNSSAHQSSAANGGLDNAQNRAVNIDNIDWSKVVFSELESIYVVERIDKNIDETAPRYREVNKVLHMKGSREGNLLYNRTRSLKSKGNGHYLGRIKLEGGNNNISIDGKSWQFSLDPEVDGEYIVVYSATGNRICILPLNGILNGAISKLPAWLPLTDTERASRKS